MASIADINTLALFLDGTARRRRAAALLGHCGTIRALMHALRTRALVGQEISARERRRLLGTLRLVHAATGASRREALVRPEHVANLCRGLWTGMVEELWQIAVDSQLRPIFVRRVASGGASQATAILADMLRQPVAVGAAGLFVAHNHPSGVTRPSAEDHAFTRALKERCDVVGLALHDHVIVAGDRWVSCVSGLSGVWLDLTREERGDMDSETVRRRTTC